VIRPLDLIPIYRKYRREKNMLTGMSRSNWQNLGHGKLSVDKQTTKGILKMR
jgi:hypothetical protein